MANRREEVLSIIRDTTSLPAVPGVITRLNSMSADNRSSTQEMARVVSSDQVLSARILRLANSPSYGYYKVSTISSAMILLGVDIVKSLALSSVIYDIMEDSLVGLWEHSLGVGVASSLIAKRLHISDCEEVATAGLLHDIGKVILKITCPNDYDIFEKEIAGESLYSIDKEQHLLGIDHADVGGYLAKTWFMPEKLVEPIACHHDITRANAHIQKAAIIHTADVLIKASGFGNGNYDFVIPFQKEAWDLLGLTEPLLAEIVEELEDKLIDVKEFCLEIQASSGL